MVDGWLDACHLGEENTPLMSDFHKLARLGPFVIFKVGVVERMFCFAGVINGILLIFL